MFAHQIIGKNQNCPEQDHGVIRRVEAERMEIGECKLGKVEIPEGLGNHEKSCSRSFCAEEKLTGDHDDQRADDPEDFEERTLPAESRPAVESSFSGLQRLIQKNHDKVVDTVENIVKMRPVPDAVEEPDRRQRKEAYQKLRCIFSMFFLCRFHQPEDALRCDNRVIDIRLQPHAQGDMPAAPEFSGVLRQEGLTKVLGKRDSEELCRADGDINHAGEIHVQLQGAADSGKRNPGSMVVRILTEKHADNHIQAVGDGKLLEKSPEDPQQSGPDVAPAHSDK